MYKNGGIGIIHRFCSIEDQIKMVKKCIEQNIIFGAAIGVAEDYLERAQELLKAGCQIIVVDIAHRKSYINEKGFRKDKCSI